MDSLMDTLVLSLGFAPTTTIVPPLFLISFLRKSFPMASLVASVVIMERRTSALRNGWKKSTGLSMGHTYGAGESFSSSSSSSSPRHLPCHAARRCHGQSECGMRPKTSYLRLRRRLVLRLRCFWNEAEPVVVEVCTIYVLSAFGVM